VYKRQVLSLNPHAGDGGLIGKEEIEIIEPVIEEMNSLGFNLRGPYASDAFFANKSYKKFDITIAMYHDQGLIPFKMISFGKGVNFTAGLNIVRTSPDHGTAFDIAGLGRADTGSTVQAIELAAQLAVSS
jgi:4-hydroxythreonine-4-phosphate dehydrogenase